MSATNRTTAPQTIDVEVFVLVDEQGDYIASHDSAQLKEVYEQQVRELDGTMGTRIVRLVLTVPIPTEIVIKATVPCTEQPATVSVS